MEGHGFGDYSSEDWDDRDEEKDRKEEKMKERRRRSKYKSENWNVIFAKDFGKISDRG